MRDVTVVRVFAAEAGGGNPAPVVVDADGMSDEEMRAVAAEYGLECGFVLPADTAEHDLRMRFWVPEHEMEMCGHATVGAVWLLDRLGTLARDEVRIATRSGTVRARVTDAADGTGRTVEVSQPAGWVAPVADPGPVLDVLGLTPRDLADRALFNAATSRTKTLVPVADVATLDGLRPRLDQVAAVCDRIGSTGLYPYAVAGDDPLRIDARQFPRSSGYPEDPATGIAATALAFGLLRLGMAHPGTRLRVRQGRAMGRPSEIAVRFESTDGTVDGCWLSGPVDVASGSSVTA